MNKLCHVPDDELIELFEKGESSSFEEIYNRYWLRLYSAAYKRLKDRETAQEIVQDLFTSIWVNRSRIKINTSLQGYLFTAVKYLVLNHRRSEAQRNNYVEILLLVSKQFDNSTSELIDYKELKEAVTFGVRQLPEKCRSVFELSRNHYKSNKEIASILGISEKTVENHINRALKYLRVNLKVIALISLLQNL